MTSDALIVWQRMQQAPQRLIQFLIIQQIMGVGKLISIGKIHLEAKRSSAKVLILSLLILLMSIYSITSVYAQEKSIPLQHIVFKDSVVADRLTAYFAYSKAEAAYIRVDKIQSGYLWEFQMLFYVEDIEKYRKFPWAEWQGHIVVIQSLVSSDQVYTLTDKTVNSNLIKYARSLPPVRPVTTYKHTKRKKGEDSEDPPPPNTIEGPIDLFEVVNGKATNFSDVNFTGDTTRKSLSPVKSVKD